MTGTTLNHSPVEPAISGTSYTWELRDLPPIESEPASPPLTDLAPRIAIKYFPGEGARNPGVKAFDDWREVSRWYSELADPQAVLGAAGCPNGCARSEGIRALFDQDNVTCRWSR